MIKTEAQKTEPVAVVEKPKPVAKKTVKSNKPPKE